MVNDGLIMAVTYLISFNMFPQVSKVKATLIISPTAKPLLIGTLPWRDCPAMCHMEVS
jgi:hypothetical protein